jgi:hypothetical protein
MVQQAHYMDLVDIETEFPLGLSWRFLAFSAGLRRAAMLIAEDDGESLSRLDSHGIRRAATDLNIFPVKVLLIAIIGRLEDGLHWVVGRTRFLNGLLVDRCVAGLFGSRCHTPSLWRV